MSEVLEKILDYPVIKQVNKREYKLVEDYKTVLPCLDRIEIKKGFIYDGASIPSVFWSLIGSPFTGEYTRPALIHDALYCTHYYTKDETDTMFYMQMLACKVSEDKAMAIYYAVKFFGGGVFNNHNQESIKYNRKFVNVINTVVEKGLMK